MLSKSLENKNPWQINISFITTLLFILTSVLFYNQSISTKKQISSLCKLYSIYEEIPEEFLYETDVDSYFYHNILDISQSHHRIVRVSKGSIKKSFAFKVFQFCDSKLQQRFILKGEVSISQKKMNLYSRVWVNFSKLLIKPTKYRRFHYPNLNLRLDFQKQKTNCSVIVTGTYLSIWTDKFDYGFGLKRTRLASFPSKSLNNAVINSFLQKLSTWVNAKSNISTRIDFLLLTSVTFLRAITMCSVFNPDYWYNNSTIFLIGDVYCPNTKCLGKLCLHKKTSISRQKRLSMPAVRVCVTSAQYSFWRSNKFLFLVVWSWGLRCWRELEMCIVPVSIVSTERNANLLVVM